MLNLTCTAALALASSAIAQCGWQLQPTGQGIPGVDLAVVDCTTWDADGAGPLPPLLVLAGDFNFAGDRPAQRIAAFDPANGQWSSLGALDAYPRALAVLPNGDPVAAGVYLVARFFPVFEATSDARDVVAWIGATTAILAATIALVQTDFKRVMAYSTISQLGYMMMALGTLGYVAAIFHLFTHAFFKALLFLGTGSVNHRTNTFDMRKMGGLKKYMPITYWTFMIGSLSLAGIFPLAGFWSKDEILLDAWRENRGLWAVGVTVAFMTAFYMFRAIFLTFHGEYKGGEPVDHHDEDSHFHGDPAHPHESAWVMTLPLILLSVPAVIAGWFAYHETFANFINHALPELPHHEGGSDTTTIAGFTLSVGIALSSTVVALAGIGVAYAIYMKKWVTSESIRSTFAPFAILFENKYYLDKLYEDVLVTRVFQGGWNRLLQANDKYVVDGIVNGSARVAREASNRLRTIQTGQVQGYGLGIAAGVIVIVLAVYTANPL